MTKGVGGSRGADWVGCMCLRGLSLTGEVTVEVEVDVEVVVVLAAAAFPFADAIAAATAAAGGGDRGAVELDRGVVLWLPLLLERQWHGAGERARMVLLLAALDGCVMGVKCPVRSAKL